MSSESLVPLTPATLSSLPANVGVPTYPRDEITTGLVHLCVGNFHRAHQALYIDKLLRADFQQGKNWGITGIGVLDFADERTKAEAMKAQSGLYTLTECPPDAPRSTRVVGSIVDYIHAPANFDAALKVLVAETTRIVSMTITEGGYNLTESGEFNINAQFIQDDLKREQPQTVFGLIVKALSLRRAQGIAPFTVLSCDNLQNNGKTAQKAILSYSAAIDQALSEWIAANVTFPCCMVDRITPATLPQDRIALNTASGVDDAVPVFGEDFTQWVVEDSFCNGRPQLELVGVQFTENVHPYEVQKLRMLNATHTMLAVPAFLAKIQYIYQIFENANFAKFAEQFLYKDVIPLLTDAPADFPTPAYAALIIKRFSNPAIKDQVTRVVGDTTSKFPIFLQQTADEIYESIQKGNTNATGKRLAFHLAAYILYTTYGISQQAQDDGFKMYEPSLKQSDKEILQKKDSSVPIITLLSGPQPWKFISDKAFVAQVEEYRLAIEKQGVEQVLQDVIKE